MRHRSDSETTEGRTGLPAESSSSLGESLTITLIVKVVRLSLSSLALLALIGVYLGVSWFRGAMSDHRHWTGNETHVHSVESAIVTDFVARLDEPDGQTAIGWSTTDRARVLSHLEAIATTPADRAESVDLAERAAHLNAAAIDYMDAVATTSASDLAETFSRFRTTVADYLDATSYLETGNLDALSKKVDILVLALAGILIVAAVVLIGAWWLDEKVRNRESALLEEISKERTLLQTIIDAMPESIIWKDTDSSVQGLNAALRDRLQLYGIAVRPGQKLTEIPMGEEMTAYIAEVERLEQQVMESGEPVTDRQMVRPERAGRRQVVLRSAIPIRRAGNIVGVLSTTRDISQVVDLERSLAAASRMQSIGQLSAGVAHEINTPVQFVADNTSFLGVSFSGLIRAIECLTEIGSEHDPEAVASIRKEADLDFLLEEIPDAIAQSSEGLAQIARIVTAMKRFAHPGGEIVETDIESLIRTTVDISRNAWKHNATVDVQIADDTPRLMCDEGQIKQVLLNMIVNAADAIADRGGETGRITIAVAQSGDSMTIRVSDTGTGMTEEVRERVFERFFTTKGAERGTGQGLAIAHDAVASHGGEILLDTELGVGTTFTIVLPLRPPRDDNP